MWVAVAVALAAEADVQAAPPTAANGERNATIVEFHYRPVANTQIAIWLEDGAGGFVRDVFVSQATAKLGIGNRSGIWNFLSSWRAPYGPRRSVLPIWAHRRGRVYPEIVFHDPAESHSTSLGFHEGTSSAEPYHCRPLLPHEHEEILDSMTCPSPQVFKTDKGRFDPGGGTSVYPPRADIATFDPVRDHVDTQQYAELNDLDAVSGATPAGGAATFQAVQLTLDEAELPELEAWIEISLEGDDNDAWSFDREADHFVDPLLQAYGIGWLGQPSVVYSVRFDPRQEGFRSASEYVGYGDWDGATGTMHAPDSTISEQGGSGADRLHLTNGFDTSFRFGVNTGKGGNCTQTPLAPVEDLTVAATSFDRVSLSFVIPNLPAGAQLARLVVHQQLAEEVGEFEPTAALDVSSFAPAVCTSPGQQECANIGPGDTVELEVPQLFGNYEYAFAVSYQDRCANHSAHDLVTVRTPEQEFAQIEGWCFVATAAYGAPWERHVSTLRRYRDSVLRPHPLGRLFVGMYYAYGRPVARVIGRSDAARAFVRGLLLPAVGYAAVSVFDAETLAPFVE
jgi:hypothetical protein